MEGGQWVKLLRKGLVDQIEILATFYLSVFDITNDVKEEFYT